MCVLSRWCTVCCWIAEQIIVNSNPVFRWQQCSTGYQATAWHHECTGLHTHENKRNPSCKCTLGQRHKEIVPRIYLANWEPSFSSGVENKVWLIPILSLSRQLLFSHSSHSINKSIVPWTDGSLLKIPLLWLKSLLLFSIHTQFTLCFQAMCSWIIHFSSLFTNLPPIGS